MIQKQINRPEYRRFIHGIHSVSRSSRLNAWSKTKVIAFRINSRMASASPAFPVFPNIPSSITLYLARFTLFLSSVQIANKATPTSAKHGLPTWSESPLGTHSTNTIKFHPESQRDVLPVIRRVFPDRIAMANRPG